MGLPLAEIFEPKRVTDAIQKVFVYVEFNFLSENSSHNIVEPILKELRHFSHTLLISYETCFSLFGG